MKTLWNLTQHSLTEEQVDDFANMVGGDLQIINISGNDEDIKNLLTFNEAPTKAEMEERANKLLNNPRCGDKIYALIGGAGYFMSTLESVLKANDITPLYSFSKRQSVEEHQEDGSVVKKNVFKHVKYIEV